ncbi:MAG: flagellar basal body-associated FliL family protein, partial [Candidatus Sumerlaeia bacterium]
HGADANGETAQASPGPSPTPTPDDGKVEFNPRLLLDPKHVADYVVVLEQQVITLQDQSRPAVRINVALEATDEDTKLEIEEKKEKIKTYIEKRVGRMTMGEARTTKAKLQLQEDIVKAANEILDHKNVREAYFVEFATDRQL